MKKLNPNLSADCVVFGYDDSRLKVLLVERAFTTSEGKQINDMKLPGGLVYNDEVLSGAALRILEQLTGLEGVNLMRFDVLDSLERMGNETDRLWLEQTTGLSIDRVVSVAYYGVVDLREISQIREGSVWVDHKSTSDLPFDHDDIIKGALKTLRESLKRDGVIFEIIPSRFTINHLQTLVGLFYDYEPDSRNFRKKLKKMDFIVPLDEKQQNVAHKPARLYRFDKKRFQQFNNNQLTF